MSTPMYSPSFLKNINIWKNRQNAWLYLPGICHPFIWCSTVADLQENQVFWWKSSLAHTRERKTYMAFRLPRRNLKASKRSITRLIDVPSSEHPLFFQEKNSFEALVAYQKEDKSKPKNDHLTSQLSYSKPTCHKGWQCQSHAEKYEMVVVLTTPVCQSMLQTNLFKMTCLNNSKLIQSYL